jgi:hypothetical protein
VAGVVVAVVAVQAVDGGTILSLAILSRVKQLTSWGQLTDSSKSKRLMFSFRRAMHDVLGTSDTPRCHPKAVRRAGDDA